MPRCRGFAGWATFHDRLYDPPPSRLGGTAELSAAADEAGGAADAALFDDLNGPEALRRCSTSSVGRTPSSIGGAVIGTPVQRAKDAFERINGVLDIVPERTGPDPSLSAWIEERIGARRDARARRDFAEADRIRSELTGRGVTIEDAGSETRWKLT
jgi:cysteinyl-tRNA synthetase